MLDVITRRVKRLSVRARVKAAYSAPALPTPQFSTLLGGLRDALESAAMPCGGMTYTRTIDDDDCHGKTTVSGWVRPPFHGPECCGPKP